MPDQRKTTRHTIIVGDQKLDCLIEEGGYYLIAQDKFDEFLGLIRLGERKLLRNLLMSNGIDPAGLLDEQE
jgi:hypothetical protein